jgi:hypothetical protein
LDFGFAEVERVRAGAFVVVPVAAFAAGVAFPRPFGAGVVTAEMASGRSDTRTVRCAVRFTTRNARPIGAGRMRFIDGP